MLNTMYFTLVFQVIVCKDIGSVDLRQILKFVIPQYYSIFSTVSSQGTLMMTVTRPQDVWLKPETHCIFGCPRQKIGIMKQSWRFL